MPITEAKTSIFSIFQYLKFISNISWSKFQILKFVNLENLFGFQLLNLILGSFCETKSGFKFFLGSFFETKSGFKLYFGSLGGFFFLEKYSGLKIVFFWPKFTISKVSWFSGCSMQQIIVTSFYNILFFFLFFIFPFSFS